MQLSGLTDALHTIHTLPSRPGIVLILTANEALEVDPPSHIVRLHEIQGRERDGSGRSPTVFADPSLRSKNAVPSRVTIIIATGVLLFGNQSVTLRSSGLIWKT
jgi:hypothetical protein